MFKKLIASIGKSVKTTSVSFMYGYNSVNEQDVVDAIKPKPKEKLEVPPITEEQIRPVNNMVENAINATS